MLLGIDHIVIAVPDLETATRNYRDLGFTVVPGGRHPTGTHNALIGFADGAYIELLAIYDPTPEALQWTKIESGGGLIDFCTQTSDLPSDTALFRSTGISMTDPAPYSRVRPDGFELHWKLSTCLDSNRGVVPFLIEDETPRGERVPPRTEHENHVAGIGTLTIAVDDIAVVRRRYSTILRDKGQTIERADLEGAGVRFQIGRHGLDFVAPRRARSVLNGWMREHGPSPFEATLITAGGKKGALDASKTLGARLALV
jgi:catechol 2,3-dioxygenase-like lactoylglutathione lyase family enzyme